jgi:hypothetical protein
MNSAKPENSIFSLTKKNIYFRMTNPIDLTELESNTNSLYEKGTMDFAHMNSDSLKFEVDLLITRFDQLLENTESNIFPPISNPPPSSAGTPAGNLLPQYPTFFPKANKSPCENESPTANAQG